MTALPRSPLTPIDLKRYVRHRRSYGQGYLEKINKMGAFHQQFSRERMIKIEVEDRWRELRPDGLEVGSPEGHSFIGELSHAISHNVLGLPRSKPFTIEDLMQIVRRKGET